MSPTQLSLRYLRANGLQVQVVEKWNPFAHIRQDLFGWIDIVAVDAMQIIGVQTTSSANVGARVAKARGNLALKNWLSAGGLLFVHGWEKKRNRWLLSKQVSIQPADLQ